MIIIHKINTKKISKRIDYEKTREDNIGFLLTNNRGNYFLSMEKKSRYSGLFFFSKDMFKILDEIVLQKSESTDKKALEKTLINKFFSASRNSSEIAENFLMPKNFNSFIYNLNKKTNFFLDFDVRKSYDSRRFGMYYDIIRDKDKLLIRFEKKSDRREDSSDSQKEFEIWIAVKCNGDSRDVLQWLEKDYEFDRERNSFPYKRYVFRAVELEASLAVITVAENRMQAEKECDFVYNNAEQFRRNGEKEFKKLLEEKTPSKTKSKNILDKSISNKSYSYFAKMSAKSSMDALSISEGILAGFPWFFQYWTRDEMMSLKALILEKKFVYVKNLLFEKLDRINDKGMLEVLNNRVSADSAALVFMRFDDFLNELEEQGLLEKYMKEEDIDLLRERLSECINCIIGKNAKNEKNTKEITLIQNNAGETWMDSLERRGACIEIQALFLRMLRLMQKLSRDKRYKRLEENFRYAVREKFWDGEVLKDNDADNTIRVNAFLACYFYPELLSREEWRRCFDFLLEKLWNKWGGLSTIDKQDARFRKTHTGESSESYHNGDSWFFVNNIAAIAMNRTDREHFKKYVAQILKADIDEILFKGIVGTSAELSSSSELKSQGCLMQAWSNATFLELVHELKL